MKTIWNILEIIERKEPGNIYSIQIYSSGLVELYNDGELIEQFNDIKELKQYVKEL